MYTSPNVSCQQQTQRGHEVETYSSGPLYDLPLFRVRTCKTMDLQAIGDWYHSWCKAAFNYANGLSRSNVNSVTGSLDKFMLLHILAAGLTHLLEGMISGEPIFFAPVLTFYNSTATLSCEDFESMFALYIHIWHPHTTAVLLYQNRILPTICAIPESKGREDAVWFHCSHKMPVSVYETEQRDIVLHDLLKAGLNMESGVLCQASHST